MFMNRWVYLLAGVLFFIVLLAFRNYLILQTTGVGGNGNVILSPVPTSTAIPSGAQENTVGNVGSVSNRSISRSIANNSTSSLSIPPSTSQIPPTQSSFPAATGNSLSQSPQDAGGPLPQAQGTDPTTLQHTSPNGGRADIEQVGQIVTSQTEGYTGDDITFTVTVRNTALYKKFVRQLCFQSTEGNFGCCPGFNLNPGQVFSISNSGRFTSSGTKSVWVTWTQDNANFYTPLDSQAARVQIL